MYGYNGNDKIYGNSGNNLLNGGNGKDSLYGGTGSDKLYGGKGNDLLQSGSNAATTFFFSKGDGTDTIKKSKASDVIQIDSVVAVKVAKNKSNKLEITYGSDKIIVDNYNFAGGSNIDTIKVKNKKGGYDTISIYEKLHGGGGGGDKVYEVNDTHLYDDPSNPLQLTSGQNNKVIFSGTYDDCYITSNNTSAYTDTLQISNYDITDAYSLGNLQYKYYGSTLYIDTMPNGGQGGGLIMYTANNTPKIAITDSKRTYNFKGYDSVQGTNSAPLNLADGNNFVYIKANEGTSFVKSNDDYNVIKTSGGESSGAALYYIYNGGHDVICTASPSNDTYNVAIGSDTSVVVHDCDGADTINVSGGNVRMIYDCGKTTVFKTQCIFMDKDVLSGMSTDEFKNIFSTTKGLNIAEMNINDSDTIHVNEATVTMDDWSIDTNNVHAAVAAWLTDNSGYSSVADALEKCTDSNLLAQLKTCFVDGTYSKIQTQPPPWSGEVG